MSASEAQTLSSSACSVVSSGRRAESSVVSHALICTRFLRICAAASGERLRDSRCIRTPATRLSRTAEAST